MNRKIKFTLLLLAVAVRLPAVAQEISPHARLDSCASLYVNGEYQDAVDILTALLPALETGEDSITALQILGSSYGMLSRIDRARDCYRIALEKRPSLEMDTLENPPNIMVIFRQVKLELAVAGLKTAAAAQAPPARRYNRAPAVVVLAAAVAGAGTAGYFYYAGSATRQKYRTVNAPDQALLDRYYRQYTTSFAACAVSAGVAAVCLPLSVYLLVRHDPAPRRARISSVDGWPALVVTF